MTTTTQSNEKAAPAVVLPVDLRDYFAAKAMQGLIAVPAEQWADLKWTRGLTVGEAMATQAYKVADAMLKARSA